VAWADIERAKKVLSQESGATVRNWGGKLPLGLVYANSYGVGMSNLAIQGLYRWLNAHPSIVCERAFAWLGARPSPQELPLTLESQRALHECAALLVSLSFELDYLNLVEMLPRASIPARARERGDELPLVILGGPAVSANPLPLSAVADAVVIGEVEPILTALCMLLVETQGLARADRLAALAQLEGVYVPALHAGEPVRRLVQPDLDEWLVASVIHAPRSEFGAMHLVEIARGCEHACRFCLAGCWYAPRRERSLEQVLAQVELGTRVGKRVGLVAASVSDYSQLDQLLDGADALGARLAVSSLRANDLQPRLMEVLLRGGTRTLTLAPEAGSQRLRDLMHKQLTADQIMRSASTAADYPFEAIKLYFIIGLPSEEDEDVLEIAQLAGQVQSASGKRVVVNVTPFVPKAHTAWQRQAMCPADVLQRRLRLLKKVLTPGHMQLRHESVRSSILQAVLARGDARVGEALLASDKVLDALTQQGNDPQAYLGGMPAPARLPWSFIRI